VQLVHTQNYQTEAAESISRHFTSNVFRAMTVGCDSDSMSAILWLLFVGFIRAQLQSQSQNVYIGYDQLYASGIMAYDQQHWFECSSMMNRAISARRAYWDNVVECRSQCALLHPFLDITPEKLLDPLYVYRASQRSKCIEDCRRTKFGGQPDVPFDAEREEAFNRLVPYDYLQLCAYKVKSVRVLSVCCSMFRRCCKCKAQICMG